jgi:hypothetical protein
MQQFPNAGNPDQKTIGLLGTGLSNDMQNYLWRGAMDAARAQGARLIFYPAYALNSAVQIEALSNILYDFVDARQID